jgi:hypothetical protein
VYCSVSGRTHAATLARARAPSKDAALASTLVKEARLSYTADECICVYILALLPEL